MSAQRDGKKKKNGKKRKSGGNCWIPTGWYLRIDKTVWSGSVVKLAQNRVISSWRMYFVGD